MDCRPPILRTLVALLAITMAACIDDEVTAPLRQLQPGLTQPGGPSLAVTYTNGNVTMTDLGVLPGDGYMSEAAAINDYGVIVGNGSTTAQPPCWSLSPQCVVSVTWPAYNAPIVTHDYLTQCFGPTTSRSSGINNAGAIVGSGRCYWSFVPYGFVRDASGVVRQLPGIADYSAANDINDHGIVVGHANVAGCDYPGPLYGNAICNRAAMWDVSGATITVTNLGDPPGGAQSYALAINNAGTIVGYRVVGGMNRAFVRSAGGSMTDIGTLPGDVQSLAQGVSENGTVVGWSAGPTGMRGFLWSVSGGMQPLPLLTIPAAINDDGIIAGFHSTPGGAGRAFAMKEGVLVDLGTLPGYTLSQAVAINARGEIVGHANQGGTMRAVRWTVVFPGVTPTGSDVNVQPTDESTGDPAPLELTFDNVTSGGETTVTSGVIGGGSGPPAPGGFRLGNPPTYYDVATTATFSGSVTLCFNYSRASYGNENQLKLLHHENGTWTDVTTSLDTTNDVICGTVTSLSPFLVAEENAAPIVTAIWLPAAPVPVGTNVTITSSFTDANPTDMHAATVSWDDGAASAGSVTESGGAGLSGASHTYTAAGVYTLSVNVSDGEASGARSSSEDQPAFIVVYDPSSGFVTGGGWFASPPGACMWSGCAEDGSTAGKASFGFVSRYQKGATAPSGSTEFQFRDGVLTFRSTSYQWLVVAGARAQYKGEGEIAGATGPYGFLITAIDGAVAGGGGTDRFRIKLWDKATGAIVYDNQTGQPDDSEAATTLGGGSIVVHR
jgi:probable HAF family extracellular repeat protein